MSKGKELTIIELTVNKHNETGTCNFCHEKTRAYGNDDILAMILTAGKEHRPLANIYLGLDENDLLDFGIYDACDNPVEKRLIKINYCPMCGRRIG